MKSSIQLTIAGITGGLTVFALSYLFNTNGQNKTNSTEKHIVEQKSLKLGDDFKEVSKLVTNFLES